MAQPKGGEALECCVHRCAVFEVQLTTAGMHNKVLSDAGLVLQA